MTAAAEAQAGPAPLAGPSLMIASLALAVGTFMQVLDTTIANVSIPTIAGDLGVSVNQGTWVITAFAVANGISVPLTGWLMGRFGVVRTFVGSVTLFTIASLLCGLAWNLESLVGFRVLQGLVSGPMIPGSQALLLMIFGRAKQATGLAIWSVTTLVAPIVGPVLGGYISDNISWPWIFLINVPVGIACALICWSYLGNRETPTRKLPVDTVGFGLLVVWVGALQVMLDTGNDADWFSSPAIVVLALVAVVGFIVWLIWELNTEHPIVDLSLFKSPNFAIATAIFCVGYAIFFANALLMPLWLQTQMSYTASWAGLAAAPAGVVAVLLTPFMARLVNKADARWTAAIAIAGFALSFFMRSAYGPDADFIELAIPMAVMGVGMAGFFMGMVTIAMNGIPPNQAPNASGLINFARITAGSFAASMTTTLWGDLAAMHQTRLAEVSGSTGDPQFWHAIEALRQQGASLAQATGSIIGQFIHQAYYLAALDIFRISGWLTLVLIPLIWFTRKAYSGGRAHIGAD